MGPLFARPYELNECNFKAVSSLHPWDPGDTTLRGRRRLRRSICRQCGRLCDQARTLAFQLLQRLRSVPPTVSMERHFLQGPSWTPGEDSTIHSVCPACRGQARMSILFAACLVAAALGAQLHILVLLFGAEHKIHERLSANCRD